MSRLFLTVHGGSAYPTGYASVCLERRHTAAKRQNGSCRFLHWPCVTVSVNLMSPSGVRPSVCLSVSVFQP